MKHFPTKHFRMMVSLIVLFFHLSCSTDTDLLADNVIIDGSKAFLEIRVIAVKNEAVVIDVREQGVNGQVTDVSEPDNGTATINPDNTITYTPDADAEGTDEFDFTVDTPATNGTVTTSTGSVKVAIGSKVAFWKTKFDEQFNKLDGVEMIKLSKSGNKFQEYYFMYYYFDGMLSIWQATGQNSYLDTMLTVINNTIADAKPIKFNASYLGWTADGSYGFDHPDNGVPLWESYYWKAVATLLRMMHQSPKLLSTGSYKSEYDKILAFTEKHIWSKWQEKGNNNLYRENAHMSSHWARIGMELYIITGKPKYKEVFDNISFGNMPGQPSNLREKLQVNPKVPSAYTWNTTWSGNGIQDIPHASDIITFCILAYENNMYWTRNDINAFISTLDKVVFRVQDGTKYSLHVDGGGGYDVPGRLRGWLKLGRYDRLLQDRLINQYQSDNANARRNPIQNIANFALNEKILADGVPVYPENP